MIEIPIACYRFDECAGKTTHKCRKCKNNRLRNKPIDYFEPANDNPIPKVNPKVNYDGPAEQTAGYKCPVCGDYTNPYRLVDKQCEHCGFVMNI